jgi:hypothetical protein
MPSASPLRSTDPFPKPWKVDRGFFGFYEGVTLDFIRDANWKPVLITENLSRDDLERVVEMINRSS